MSAIRGVAPHQVVSVVQERLGTADGSSCAVLVALIGPQWATLADEEGNEVDVATWRGRD